MFSLSDLLIYLDLEHSPEDIWIRVQYRMAQLGSPFHLANI